MKTKLIVLAMIVCLVMVSTPALAGDWYADLKEQIIEKHDVVMAIKNAEKAHVDREDIMMAIMTLADYDPTVCSIIAEACRNDDCCGPSPGGTCSSNFYDLCTKFDCCDEPPVSQAQES